MGGGVCGGGVAYGQTPPTMGLASTPASLSSRIAMRNHRVVPYTSPTPRAARTPPGKPIRHLFYQFIFVHDIHIIYFGDF